MKKKSLMVLMMIMMLVVVAMFTMASCGEEADTTTPSTPSTPTPTPTVHEYGEWTLVKLPTTTETGEVSRTCTKCQAVEKYTLPVNVGNTYSINIKTNPTCAEEGIAEFTLETIGFTFEAKLPMIDHTYTEWAVKTPATCTSKGVEHRVCTVCGKELTRDIDMLPHEYEQKYDDTHHWTECASCHEIKDKVEHTFTEWTVIKPATATEDAVEERRCECGKVETRIVHDYAVEIFAPTCTEQGYSVYTCKKCGHVHIDDYVEPTGHQYGEVVYEFSPDGKFCTATRSCLLEGCLHREVIQATVELEVSKPATCKDEGEGKYIAMFDEPWATTQEIDKIKIPKTDHEWEMKFDETGHWMQCKVCEKKKDFHAHDLEIFSDDEQHWMHCKDCDFETPKMAHPYIDWIVDVAPTCTTPGRRHGECRVCHQQFSEEMPPLGHDYVYIDDGEHHHKICKRMGCDYVGGIEEHHLEPGHDENYHWQQCVDCGAKIDKEYHGDSYKYDAENHWIECEKCGYIGEVESHTWSDLIVDVAPTCLTAGKGHRVCTKCNYRIEEDIPSLGHHLICVQDGDKGHHFECDRADCGYVGEIVPHEMVDAYDGTEHYKQCKHCYYREAGHAHNLVKKYNDEYSWDECTECGYKSEPEKHLLLGIPDVVEPTCTQDGTSTRHCTKCGHDVVTVLPALGHNIVYVDDGDTHHAMCDRKGCGYVGEAMPHHLVPSFDENGHFDICEDCGHKINVLPHTPGPWTIMTEPTKEKEGVLCRYCPCGYLETTKLPKLEGGKYRIEASKPVCGEVGIEKYIYELNGQRFVFTVEYPKLAHKYDDKASAYSFEKNGLECTAVRYCLTCGEPEYVKTTEISKVVLNESTCSAPGRWKLTAKFKEVWAGEHTEIVTVPQLDHHVFVGVDIGTHHRVECKFCHIERGVFPHQHEQYYDATHHWIGCSVAGCTHKESIEAHDLVYKSDDTAHWMECTGCGYVSVRENHKYGDWIVDVKPTCDQPGKRHRECVCGQQIVEEIAPLGHDFVYKHDDTHHYRECTRCGAKTEMAEHELVHKYDGTHHWDECIYCGAHIGECAHDLDANGSCRGCLYQQFKMVPTAGNDGYILVANNVTSDDIDIPGVYNNKPVVGIARTAFIGNKTLKSIHIPSSIKAIEMDAFAGCTSLTAVYIDNITAWCSIAFDITGNPLTIAHNLYFNNVLVTDLQIPVGTERISNRAFEGCTSIETVTLAASVKIIGEDAFAGCTNIKTVDTLPDSILETIESGAFRDATALTAIHISTSVTTMGANVFVGCSNAVVSTSYTEAPQGWDKNALNGVKEVVFASKQV